MPAQSHRLWKKAGGGQCDTPPQDGSITHEEEFRLRRFRDRLGLNRSSAHAFATAQLNLTSRQRLTGLTQAAATTVEDGDRLLKQLSEALRKAGFG